MAEVAAKAARYNSELVSDFQTKTLAERAYLISEVADAIDNEFNNVMMAVAGYAELELRKAPPNAKRRGEQVLENLTRATYLGQKLLALSRNRLSTPQPLNLNDTISDLTRLLREVVGDQIELIVKLDSNPQTINADPVELEQLLAGLAILARNAISRKGKLYLSTKSVEVDAPSVMLSVSTAATLTAKQPVTANVVAPHYDPKSDLTASAVERIAKSVGGIVCVPGEASDAKEFVVYFPALERKRSTKQDIPETYSGVSKTILIVDDDDAVRIPAVEFLKMEGFKVLQAKTGPEALNIVSQKRSPVDLLITDIVMPEMSGREVAERLSKMCADLKVLYMSGDAGEGLHSPIHMSHKSTLHKPFRLENLNQRIQALLSTSEKQHGGNAGR
jgi:CheY-like chemotaxis protein